MCSLQNVTARLDTLASNADSLAMTTPDREPVYEVVWPLAPAAAPAATLADRVGDLSGTIAA